MPSSDDRHRHDLALEARLRRSRARRLRCDSSANASSSSRVRPHFSAMSSAEIPCGTRFGYRSMQPRAERVRPASSDEPIGTRVMLSTPAAITTSYAPAITPCAAKCSACCDEPHCRSIDVPGTVSGKPAASSALRPMLSACSPTCDDAAHDHVVDHARDRGRCASTSVAACARRGRPGASPASWPLRRPSGVRTASTIDGGQACGSAPSGSRPEGTGGAR